MHTNCHEKAGRMCEGGHTLCPLHIPYSHGCSTVILLCEALKSGLKAMKEAVESGMENAMEKPASRRLQRLRVPVFGHEKAQISESVGRAGLSMACYLRNVGLGYSVQPLLDTKDLRDLMKANADLARLGNLLKLWLDNDVRTYKLDRNSIERLKQRMDLTRAELRRLIAEARGYARGDWR